MSEVKRKYVLPGDYITEGNYRLLSNVTKIGDAIHSTRIGIAEISKDGVKVIPLSGIYIPRVGDLVIGKIIGQSALAWEVDINSCFSGHLPAQDVFDKDFNPSRDDMKKKFNIGDLIACRIAAFDRTRDPLLTVADKDLGKIKEGEVVKISPTKVPRLIGKRGSMIQTIEQATKCSIIVGQNGIIVVSGPSEDAVLLTIKAIKTIEEEAHTANLTQRIKEMLEKERGEIE
ncbi:MAG: RNA-binding protein [Candidatus Nitrosocaldaceae archaeon]|nr:MAG: RNA-binding protein [Candidatus Nitrosocaldaceae archaeon]